MIIDKRDNACFLSRTEEYLLFQVE